MHRFRLLMLVLVTTLFTFTLTPMRPLAAQTELLTLTLDAGYDGVFRDQQWMPIVIQVRNNGLPVRGRLIVRPETSGNAVGGIFSTPIDLSEGAAQMVTLAITARGIAQQIRVELIDDEGVIAASASAPLRAIQTQDRLVVVITESPIGAVDLTGVTFGSFDAYQAVWTPPALPDRAALLDAVDTVVIHDADTGSLTQLQRDALTDYVIAGGHLIVGGGANWQPTVAGIAPLLPMTLTGSDSIPSLRPLADWLVLPAANAALDRETLIAAGSLQPDAQTLASTDDGSPLLVRGSYGGGTVDLLTADPLSQPLRGWREIGVLWTALITSQPPQPGWTNAFTDWDQAVSAVQILPGFDPLPDALPLCGFLLGYIALIGPVNYLVLSRINRREWAWITIPVLIALFTVISFAVGSNLRGSEAVVNRLTVVRAWDGIERARADSLIGLLSPRRTVYSLASAASETLRTIPRQPLTGATFIANSAQTPIEISQTEVFSAQRFIVDASFIAPFTLTGMLDRPPLSGSATFVEDDAIPGQQRVIGSIRNDGVFTVLDPVVLARGSAVRLADTLAAGELLTFELVLPGEGSSSPVLRSPSPPPSYQAYRGYQFAESEQSAVDILGTDRFSNNLYSRVFSAADVLQQEWRRRQFLLSALVDDSFGTTGRGDEVYFAGWSNDFASAAALQVEGAEAVSEESTLFLIQLAREIETAADRTTLIPMERFTWVTLEQTGIGNVAPVEVNFQPGEQAVFRFTPFADAVLETVESMTVIISNINTGGRSIPIEIRNWTTGEWETINVVNGERLIDVPTAYLGVQNAVDLRITTDTIGGGFLRVGRIGVQQRGGF